MADKTKPDATIKNGKPKRPSTVSIPTSSRTKILPKEKPAAIRPKKTNQDTPNLEQEQTLPDFDEKYREMAYSQFMSEVLDDCVIGKKIKREETPIEILMTQLADRFRKTIDQLDKTNKRLNDISFVVEKKRLVELKSSDSSQFYTNTDDVITDKFLEDIPEMKQAYLDNVGLQKVDFGYDKNSGHKQLLDAVNDAIEGLEKIKKESNIDMYKFEDFDGSKENIGEDKINFDVEGIKSEFEAMFPKISRSLLQEQAEKIAKMFDNDNDGYESDDD